MGCRNLPSFRSVRFCCLLGPAILQTSCSLSSRLAFPVAFAMISFSIEFPMKPCYILDKVQWHCNIKACFFVPPPFVSEGEEK